MNLFTDDTRFVVYLDASANEPMQELRGRQALATSFQRAAHRVRGWGPGDRRELLSGPSPVGQPGHGLFRPEAATNPAPRVGTLRLLPVRILG